MRHVDATSGEHSATAPPAAGRPRRWNAVRAGLRWGGLGILGIAGLLLLAIGIAALTDRPSADVLTVDRDAPEVVRFLEAERAWLAHHGLDFTAHTVEVDDPRLRVRVLEVGDGPPVLLLPGGPGEAAFLAPLAAELDGHRLLLVNLPGGGASDGADLRAIDDRRLARATLDAVYDYFELNASPIVGASRGGSWALFYALDRPDRVAASVQLGVSASIEGATPPPAMLRLLGVPGLNRILLYTLRPTTSEEALEGFELLFGHPAATLESLPEETGELLLAQMELPTYALSWRSIVQGGTTRFAGLSGWELDFPIGLDDLAGVDHPVLLAWPQSDPFGDLDLGRAVADALPDGELAVVGIGHLPWLDDPAGTGELVAGFLERNRTP